MGMAEGIYNWIEPRRCSTAFYIVGSVLTECRQSELHLDTGVCLCRWKEIRVYGISRPHRELGGIGRQFVI